MCDRVPESLLFIPLGFVMLFVIQVILWDNILMQILTQVTGVIAGNANNYQMIGMVRENPLFIGFLICVFGPVLENRRIHHY